MIRPVEPTRQTPRPPARGAEPAGMVIENGTDSETRRSESRALVPTETHPRHREVAATYRTARPEAAFLAHLIATEAGDPQTRARRQLPADETAMRYAEAVARPAATRVTASRAVTL